MRMTVCDLSPVPWWCFCGYKRNKNRDRETKRKTYVRGCDEIVKIQSLTEANTIVTRPFTISCCLPHININQHSSCYSQQTCPNLPSIAASYLQPFYYWPSLLFSLSIPPSVLSLCLLPTLPPSRTETGLIEINELGSKSDLITSVVWGCWLRACWVNVADWLVMKSLVCLLNGDWTSQTATCSQGLSPNPPVGVGRGKRKPNDFLFLFAHQFWTNAFFVFHSGNRLLLIKSSE